MNSQCYILFRNADFADELVKEFKLTVKRSRSEIRGIDPQNGDLLLIDAHFEGQMTDLNGLDIVNEFIKLNQGNSIRILVFSWFSLEYITSNNPNKAKIFRNPNVQYYRFPVNISKLIQ